MFHSRAFMFSVAAIVLLGVGSTAFFLREQWPREARPQAFREEPSVSCPTGSAQLVDLSVSDPFDRRSPSSAVPQGISTESADVVLAPPTFVLTEDKFRMPRGSLRRSDHQSFEGRLVGMTFIVGTSGDVLLVAPTSGPKELFADAIGTVRGTKLVPILRDGSPVVARIDNIEIVVQPLERRSPKPRSLPVIKDWDSLRIGYEENWIGANKRFQIEIRGDGTITYLGRDGVALAGRHCARISRAQVKRLVDAFRKAEFWQMDEAFRGEFSHGPLVRTSMSFDGVQKTVEQFAFGTSDMPDALPFLQHVVIEVAGGRRWTDANEETVTALRAEGWDFKRKDTDNTSMISGAARHGDAAAVAALIDAGAPLTNVDAVPGREWLLADDNPLVGAANRGAFDIVQILLRTNTRWSKVVLGHALVAGAQYGNAAFCKEMLKRGASVSTRDVSGKTALMSAAESGVPEVVSLVLAAGASVSEADGDGQTALHWVGKDPPFNRLEPSAMNRRAVVDLLVRAGGVVDKYDELRFTPLVQALNERPDVVAALIAHDADVNRRVGDNGSTALMANNNPETIRLLLEAGADPFLRDEFGRTAFQVLKNWNERRSKPIFWRERREHERALEAQAILERWMKDHPQRQ